MARWPAAVIASLLTYFAAAATATDKAGSPRAGAITIEPASLSSAALRQLKIRRVRLESTKTSDSDHLTLKFDILNESDTSVANVVFQVVVIEMQADAHGRIVAGPLTIRSKEALGAENTMAVEMLLEDVSPTCRCRPLVRIVSANLP